jgi:hypothetical protein
MKVSKLVKTLEDFQNSFGDLEVTLSSEYPETTPPGVSRIIWSEHIFVGVDGGENGDEINIRNFPY